MNRLTLVVISLITLLLLLSTLCSSHPNQPPDSGEQNKNLVSVQNHVSSYLNSLTSSEDSSSSLSFATKRRKVVRRRRKKVKPVVTEPTTTIRIPNEDSKQQVISELQNLPISKHHSKKRLDVWKVAGTEVDPLVSHESESDKSNLSKRDSTEGERNATSGTRSSENAPDLHTEESTNPFVNTSTPISNELQNSLQFTLNILHPLLNSDSVLSETAQKIPEDKTVRLTHSLSNSVAHTPIAHDLGFLPTHLRKKHPLLSHDTIFSSDDGASKNGIRTRVHPIANDSSVEVPSTTSTQPPTSKSTSTTVKPSQKEPVTVNSIPFAITTPVTTTQTNIDFSKELEIPIHFPFSTTTLRNTNNGENMTSSTVSIKYSPYPTTTAIVPTSTLSPFKTPDEKPDYVGQLNITEIVQSSSEIKANNVSVDSGSEEGDHYLSSVEDFSHPPIIMLPADDNKSNVFNKVQGSNFEINSDKPTPAVPSPSLEEQLLIEQLLGISPSTNNSATSRPSDSNELLQLLNIIQSQTQNKANPSSGLQIPPTSIENQSQGFQNLLQSLLQPQTISAPANNQNAQFDLASLLNLAQQTPPTSGPTATQGLSDSDLKSIFALLDSQATPAPTTTTKRTTTTPPTTTTTTTTTTTPRPPVVISTSRPLLTTTLHPALQSMLDLFNNQIKPFQSIPQDPIPNIQGSQSTEVQTNVRPPTTTTTPVATPSISSVTPAPTANSLDILSQLLSFGSLSGTNKVNSARSTPQPDFSLASLFGGNSGTGQNNNIFPSNFANPPPSQYLPATTPSASNHLLNFFGGDSGYQPTTPPPPSGLYYWLDMNAFLGGDTRSDGSAGIRPKMGSKYPFIRV